MKYVYLLLCLFGSLLSADSQQRVNVANDVAAYIWPAYHNEPRFKEIGVFLDGKGEWEAVYNAKPKLDGHRQPRVLLWGYLDEADPKAQEKKIATALEYGVNTFIFDWCWYDNKPFLEDALNKGFLKVKNNKEMNFYLMWANLHIQLILTRRSRIRIKCIGRER